MMGQRRLWPWILTILGLLGAVIVVVGAVPAAANNAVGGSTTAVANTVGVATDIGAGHRLGKTVLRPAIVVATGVAAKSSTSLIGKSYGLGTVVESPGLTIQGFRGAKGSSHALNQIINRGVSPSMLRNTVAEPKVVLRQGSSNYLHLSDEAAVVLRPDGQVVTAYGRADFRQHVLGILADVG